MSEHKKCLECAERRRDPLATVKDIACDACAGTGIVPDLEQVHRIKDLALPGKRGALFKECFLERFPTGTATTRELLLWLADTEDAGPDWFFSQCIGVSQIHAKFYNTIEQATREALRRVATGESPSEGNGERRG